MQKDNVEYYLSEHKTILYSSTSYHFYRIFIKCVEIRRINEFKHAWNSYDQPFGCVKLLVWACKYSFEVLQKVVWFDLVGQMNVLSLIN